ncbi:DNA-formamidopyrimidine glycosylase family protein [Rathayibacter sp. YIM 133350]|uniref:DNA-formamidopyrimidine glycosylase family protein n=1 Tax=Rathayibacter sp. YIM 133350 TaxID=3131992 RepID=UPI00307DAFDA
MPEGDTVYQAANRLRAALAGEVLTRTDIRVPRYATLDLAGETVDSVASRGKHLLIRVGEFTLHSHLKMEGAWRVFAPGERWNRPAFQARAVLTTADAVAVGFELGLFEVLARSAEEDAVGYLGPDLLGTDWDAAEAERRIRNGPEVPIDVALLDQRNLAGLGNVYANELCFLRGVRPQRPVAEVPDLPKVIDLGHRLITANRDRIARVTTGVDRRGQRLWVYGRGGEPCRRCGTRIEQGELGRVEGQERVTYWCPRCQT